MKEVYLMKSYLQTTVLFLILMLIVPMIPVMGHPPVLQDKPENHSPSSEKPSESEKEEPTVRVYLHQEKKVKEVPITEYVASVVCSEMPASFREEALKAQAVLAQTYAIRLIRSKKSCPDKSLQGAQISSDPAVHQAYCTKEELKKKMGRNYQKYWNKILSCTEEVKGRILTYQNEPAIVAFHAVSCGHTESAEQVWGKKVPYLTAVNSEGDLLSPHYEDTKTFSVHEMKSILRKKYPSSPPDFSRRESEWFKILSITPSGYVSKVSVLDKTLSGTDLRDLLGLRSAGFTVSGEKGIFRFTTRGYGHGVGMSQYGADYLAGTGKDYREILAHYFPGTAVGKISPNWNKAV